MFNPFKTSEFGRTVGAIAFTAVVSSTLLAGAVGPAYALQDAVRSVVVTPGFATPVV